MEREAKHFFTCTGIDEEELDYAWEEMLRGADTNKDGKISREEFLTYVMGDAELLRNGAIKDKNVERKLRVELALLSPAGKLASNLFEVLDADGSGALDEEESKMYLTAAGCIPAELDFYWKDLLRLSDGNADGLVSKEEFLRYTFNDVELDESLKFKDDGFSKTLDKQIRHLGPAGKLVGTLFDIMDADKSGYMEEGEGKRYLSAIGCDPAELDYYWADLKRCADTNRDGKISRGEFLHFVLGDTEMDDQGSITDLAFERKIRDSIAKLGPAGEVCSKLFDCIDIDQSGFLDEYEIKQYLTMQGMPQEELDYYVEDIMRTSDADQDGVIGKDEFLSYVLGDEELDEQGSLEPEAMANLLHQLKMNGPAAQLTNALFDLVDSDGSGFLEEDEGKLFLQLQGCDEEELDYYWSDLLRTADVNRDGKLNKVEFVNYILGDTELTADGEFVSASDENQLKLNLATMGAAGKLTEKLFDLIDQDGSGYLDEEEGKKFLEVMGTDPAEIDYYWADLARCADTNRDGRISKQEFLNYTLGEVEIDNDGSIADPEFELELRTRVRLMGSAAQKVSTLFDVIDDDGSGYLEEQEGKRFLVMVGCEVAELDYYWSDMLRVADANLDGKISKAEFMQYTMGDVDLDDNGDVDPEFEQDLQQKIVMMGPAGSLVRALFDAIDVDRSGYMEEPEGKCFFEMMGCDPDELDYYWTDLLRCADANSDGMISKEEFVRYTMGDIEVNDDGTCEEANFESDMRRKIMVLGPAGRLVTALFETVDADGSGFLEAAEGKKFLAAVGCDNAELEYYWQDILRTADENQDGKISKDEFLVYILGDEELTFSGDFVDEERAEELSAALRSLGGSFGPPASPRIPEGVPQRRSAGSAASRPSTSGAGMVEVVLTALKTHGTSNAEVAQAACMTLWNVAYSDKDGARQKIVQSGGVTALVRVMRRHTTVVPIQEAGCGVLWALSHSGSANRASVSREGGLDVTIAVLTRGAHTPTLLEAACATLGNLALEPTQKQTLKRKGAAQLVETAMQNFPGDSDLQSAGCMSLNNLM
eukprot:COSAG02_NODE_4152_length_5709_cov_15.912121_3_plen_1048_part_00